VSVYAGRMDALTSLLNGPRAQGAFLLRSLLDPPWSIRIRDEAPLTLVAMMRGDAWLRPDDAVPMHLRSGQIAIIRGPEPYTVADDPATAPQIIIHPGQRCTTVDGVDLAEAMHLGIRTWGNSAVGATMILTGTYQMRGEVSRRLLVALPAFLVIPDDVVAGGAALLGMLSDELAKDGPGQEVILDRLLDLLLITVLRGWFARPESEAPAWYRAHGDPAVGPALRLLHHNPAHPWTVADLASAVGVSRAGLARRFTDLVGEPPMAYLTSWRLALAADLLREPHATVGAVARQVGYGTPFALSTAFKRERGLSPQQYRSRQVAA
jgi:AraC-like DNA-binding protein